MDRRGAMGLRILRLALAPTRDARRNAARNVRRADAASIFVRVRGIPSRTPGNRPRTTAARMLTWRDDPPTH